MIFLILSGAVGGCADIDIQGPLDLQLYIVITSSEITYVVNIRPILGERILDLVVHCILAAEKNRVKVVGGRKFCAVNLDKSVVFQARVMAASVIAAKHDDDVIAFKNVVFDILNW